MIHYQYIASCILWLSKELGYPLTNMQLQKLMYYAQGFSLALLGKPMYEDDIEAWRHGPVVPDLYQDLKMFKSLQIPVNHGQEHLSLLSGEQVELLRIVVSNFGFRSGSELRRLSHREEIWKSHCFEDGSGDDSVITKDEIAQFFTDALAVPDSEYSEFMSDMQKRLDDSPVQIPNTVVDADSFVHWVRQQ